MYYFASLASAHTSAHATARAVGKCQTWSSVRGGSQQTAVQGIRGQSEKDRHNRHTAAAVAASWASCCWKGAGSQSLTHTLRAVCCPLLAGPIIAAKPQQAPFIAHPCTGSRAPGTRRTRRRRRQQHSAMVFAHTTTSPGSTPHSTQHRASTQQLGGYQAHGRSGEECRQQLWLCCLLSFSEWLACPTSHNTVPGTAHTLCAARNMCASLLNGPVDRDAAQGWDILVTRCVTQCNGQPWSFTGFLCDKQLHKHKLKQ